MIYQRASEGGWDRNENTMAPRKCSQDGPIAPMNTHTGFVAAVNRNPYLWGAAIAFAGSGIWGWLTL